MINADQPAFPMKVNPQEIRRADSEYNGLTKREYFAAMAMQGFCSSTGQEKFTARQLAEWSAEQADELIKQLETK